MYSPPSSATSNHPQRSLTIPFAANNLFTFCTNERLIDLMRRAPFFSKEPRIFAGIAHVILDDNDADQSILKILLGFST